jgi:flotillin
VVFWHQRHLLLYLVNQSIRTSTTFMDFFASVLAISAVALLVLAISGVGHHGSRVGHHHAQTRARLAHKGAHHSHHDSGGMKGLVLLSYLSPLTILSFLFGLGACGLLLNDVIPGFVPRLGVSVVGGVLWQRFVVTPLWSALMSFASRPAHTLEDAVSGYAQAVTSFNVRGEGIVAVELDGQQQRLLATLASDDRNGEPVAAGATFVRSISRPAEPALRRFSRHPHRLETVNNFPCLQHQPETAGPMIPITIIILLVFFVAIVFPVLFSAFLKNVPAGTIRLVTWLGGTTRIYRGPGKSYEVPLLTNGTTISSKAINVDLDITDQTADVGPNQVPSPIKVRVLASAIVSVGDSETLIKTAANRFFAKREDEQMSTLTDLLSSSGRRAVNLLTHDQLFSARSAPVPHEPQGSQALTVAAEEDDDPLAIIIRKACSRELTDLGLVFNSLNIKVVQSEVADARRRQSAAEATANAAIVAAEQDRRATEAQLEAQKQISNKQRELEQTRLANAVLISLAEAKKQEALVDQKDKELKATQITQARADAEAVIIAAQAKADAAAAQITTVARANAQAIEDITNSIKQGGADYIRFRQVEMLPQLTEAIADALSQARLVTLHSGREDGNAAQSTTDSVTSVIRTLLAAQFLSGKEILADNSSVKESSNSDVAGNRT